MSILMVRPMPPEVKVLFWTGCVSEAMRFFKTDQVLIEKPSGALCLPFSSEGPKCPLKDYVVTDMNSKSGYRIWDKERFNDFFGEPIGL